MDEPQKASSELAPNQIVSYKKVGAIELSLHIFQPAECTKDSKRPAIVFFFGGGWQQGNIAQFYGQSAYLASRGIVALCAEYRFEGQHGTSPIECVKDAKSAMRWVRAHAEDFGIDSSRIAAGGGSAGGHLAVATAVLVSHEEEAEAESAVSCVPDALVLFNPVFDNGPEGYGFERVEAYWRSFSPLHNLKKGMPPTTVFLGTEDHHIPVETAERFQQTMEDLENRCDLHLYKGEKHGFFNQSRFKETLLETDRFLASIGFLSGQPTF